MVREMEEEREEMVREKDVLVARMKSRMEQ
jgi:hypothetical protein